MAKLYRRGEDVPPWAEGIGYKAWMSHNTAELAPLVDRIAKRDYEKKLAAEAEKKLKLELKKGKKR